MIQYTDYNLLNTKKFLDSFKNVLIMVPIPKNTKYILCITDKRLEILVLTNGETQYITQVTQYCNLIDIQSLNIPTTYVLQPISNERHIFIVSSTLPNDIICVRIIGKSVSTLQYICQSVVASQGYKRLQLTNIIPEKLCKQVTLPNKLWRALHGN